MTSNVRAKQDIEQGCLCLTQSASSLFSRPCGALPMAHYESSGRRGLHPSNLELWTSKWQSQRPHHPEFFVTCVVHVFHTVFHTIIRVEHSLLVPEFYTPYESIWRNPDLGFFIHCSNVCWTKYWSTGLGLRSLVAFFKPKKSSSICRCQRCLEDLRSKELPDLHWSTFKIFQGVFLPDVF